MQQERKGLLLGAGFSAPVGMPLVKQLTGLMLTQLAAYRKAKQKRWLLSEMGYRRYAEVVLGNGPLWHYEQFVGALEDDCLNAAENNEETLFLCMADQLGFLELINETLSYCQQESSELMVLARPYFRGLAALSHFSRPLWIFSLNHDCATELIASSWRIPLATDSIALSPPGRLKSLWNLLRGEGAWSTRVVGVRDPSRGPSDESEMFFRPGNHGINMVKLHGSINHYIDVTDASKCKHLQFAPHQHLPWAWRNLIETHSLDFNNDLMPALNHKHLDLAGKKIRVRNTILSGTHKFTEQGDRLHNSAAAPSAFLLPKDKGWTVMYEQQRNYQTPISSSYLQRQMAHFERYINEVDHLIAIGYSIGDSHVNEVVKSWLTSDERRVLSIVRPAFSDQEHGTCDAQERAVFGHLVADGRVRAVRKTTTEFLADVAEPQQGQVEEKAFNLALSKRGKEIEESCSVALALARFVTSDDPEDLGDQIQKMLEGGLPKFDAMAHAVASNCNFPGAPNRE